MKIALFGASGEIGGYLYQVLTKQGHTVTSYIRNSPGPILSRLVTRNCKLNDYSVSSLVTALANIDVVVNAAIDKTPGLGAAKTIESNSNFVNNLLDAAEKVGVKKFVHFSSIVVLPPQLDDEVLQKSTPSSEKDWYTLAKKKTEQICLEHATNSKMKIIILRPGIVYGAYMMWSRIAFRRLSETGISLPAKKSTCAAVHPVDIARLVGKIITTKPVPQIIYAINPEKISWFDYYQGHSVGTSEFSQHPVLINEKEPKTQGRLDILKIVATEILIWIKDAPFWKYLVHLPFILPAGSKVMTALVYSKTIVNKPGDEPSYIPLDFERNLYLSHFNTHKIQTGKTIGFKYKISFTTGVKSASLWWKGF